MPKEFVRGKAPMTKEEVRLLSVARLCLKENDVLYDIESGTGSIAVFAASLSLKIKAYAIECNDEAVSLIKENAARFHTENVTVIKEMAPEGLEKHEKAGAAFIGGSKGNLRLILKKLHEINPNMRVVMNAVSMESIVEMNQCLKEFAFTEKM